VVSAHRGSGAAEQMRARDFLLGAGKPG